MKIYQDSRFIQSDQCVICVTNVMVDFGIIDLQHEFTVTGKAKCAEGDKFDFSVGKRLAETRASKKVYKKVSKMYEKLIAQITADFNTIKFDENRVLKLLNKETVHLQKLQEQF